MSKDLHISVLIDFYGDLLTEKQQQALDFYYNEDLSLFEIAQHMNISRQGVRDFIKRGEKQLIDMEYSLGLAKRFTRLSSQIDEINGIIEKLKGMSVSEEVGREIKKLEDITERIKENL